MFLPKIQEISLLHEDIDHDSHSLTVREYV